jgi:dolichyl-phosphate-mannose-protein mannosyltransferase
MSSGHSAIHIGEPSPRSSSEFEDLGASTYHARHQQEADLPLYHMQEDITRRRVPRGNGARSDVDHDQSELEPLNKGGYDDEKHAYAKMNTPKSTGMGGGRIRRGPLPPPSNLVSPRYTFSQHHGSDCGQREFFEQNIEHIAPVIYTLLSCWTRFYRIGKADNVVWDEAHFGKFGGYYIKREFYFDVHPPLGKMLVGLAGFLSGFDGRFEFKSGEKYPDDVPYVAMRVLLACFGVAMVPLGWYTAVELGMSWRACHMVAVMVLCGQHVDCQLLSGLCSSSCRCCLAVYLSVHSSGLDASVLHLPNRFLPIQVPQPAIPVRISACCSSPLLNIL